MLVPVPAAPLAVACPWCKQDYPTHRGAGCTHCRGPLPAPIGMDRGAPAAPPPRRLPESYERRVRTSKNVLAVLGIGFAAVGALFVVLGLGLLFRALAARPRLHGLRRRVRYARLAHAARRAACRRKQLVPLIHAVAAEGQILGVVENTQEMVGDRHPYRIDDVFHVHGRPASGTAEGWSPLHAMRQRGEPVWVVFLPSDPAVSCIWPPPA